MRLWRGLDVPVEKVYGDICEVAAGKKPGRENDKELITYAPAGMGAVDVGIALEALRLAEENNIGKEIVLAKE